MIHHANAPLPGILAGIAWYRQNAIPLHKLDVALPWFAYLPQYICYPQPFHLPLIVDLL